MFGTVFVLGNHLGWERFQKRWVSLYPSEFARVEVDGAIGVDGRFLAESALPNLQELNRRILLHLRNRVLKKKNSVSNKGRDLEIAPTDDSGSTDY